MNLTKVARRARVSTATVSRVLNGVGEIKSATRARVLKAVEELRYYPNLHARSLAGRRSRTIGVIVSNLGNPFFFDIYKEIEPLAQAQSYQVIVANTDYNSVQLVTSIRSMIGRRVEGLAAIVPEIDVALIDELHASEIPTVFYNVGATPDNITIRVDHSAGIRRVIDYLYRLGHRRFGLIGHHVLAGPLDERTRTVIDAVAQYKSVEVHTVTCEDTLEGGRASARSLLADGFAPTAVVCLDDVTAIGALRELRDQGRRIPEDVSVTGLGNVKLAEFSVPPLTTIHIPRDRIGRLICDCLLAKANQGTATQPEIVIDTELIVRESSGPAREAGDA